MTIASSDGPVFLVKLALTNYRGFANHVVPLRPTTVVVGRNNAGKSTIVEALRVLSLVITRSAGLAFKPPPDWLATEGLNQRGVAPDISDLELPNEALFHGYAEPPAEVHATFSTSCKISIFLGGGNKVFAFIYDPLGDLVRTRGQLAALEIPMLYAMPQPGPVAPEELRLGRDTVRRGMNSRRSPTHFRNQLLYAEEAQFETFAELVATSWGGLAVKALAGEAFDEVNGLALIVRNGNFAGDIAMLGHGAQVWLQTLWFMVRCNSDSIVVFDEPEVYLHPDLQRRLMRLIAGRFRQTVLTTHSVEILSETDPRDVLVIDRGRPNSGFAAGAPGLQAAVSSLGSAHNLQLARLWSARKMLIVEGHDVELLRAMAAVLGQDVENTIADLPTIAVEGWGGWERVVGSSLTVKNALDEAIEIFTIFDSDYHPDEEIADRYDQAKKRKVRLHVWARKELESYLLVPSVIARVINDGSPATGALDQLQGQVAMKLMAIVAELRDDALADHQGEHTKFHRSKDPSTNIREATRRFGVREQSGEGILALVPPKIVLSRLSAWSQFEFGVSFGAARVARSVRLGELHPEVAGVLRAIHDGQPMPGWQRPGVRGPGAR